MAGSSDRARRGGPAAPPPPSASPILLVEDDREIARLLCALLRDAGYRVAVAADGPGALAAVLLDVRLPGVDGVEVCRRLRADPRTRAVPVLFLTAAWPAELRERLAGVAYQGLLRKPFAFAEVLAALRRALGA
jgi:CheY-like chemotaxis protein